MFLVLYAYSKTTFRSAVYSKSISVLSRAVKATPTALHRPRYGSHIYSSFVQPHLNGDTTSSHLIQDMHKIDTSNAYLFGPFGP